MQSGQKDSVYSQSVRRNCSMRIRQGVYAVMHNPFKLLIFVIFLSLGLSLILSFYALRDTSDSVIRNMQYVMFGLFFEISYIPMLLLILFLMGKPKEAWKIDPAMQRICVQNGIGETPILYEYKKLDENNAIMLTFVGYGIPLSFYKDKLEEIEASLNINIASISQGDSLYKVKIMAVKYENALDRAIHWKESFLSDDDFMLIVGESPIGKEKVNLNKLPHILIGGSTGSGKSVLLKNLVYQAAKKDADVYIADFKGGIDFNGPWRNITTVITSMDKLIWLLNDVLTELESRKERLLAENVVNISEYNKGSQYPLKRIVIACDEVAELLDKTGLDKETKEKVNLIESALSTIARQGRAFGIHLILATQRPDANILSGQIRNNIDYRICGRADDILSKIVLDNTDASERIDKNSQGLFLTNTGVLLKAYFFTENDVVV